MGTDYAVKVAHFPENADWQKVTNAIQDRLDMLDQMMSTYRQDSEVCRFNASSSTEDWFPVSLETAHLVQTSLEIAQLSEGALDITVAPLVRHWGFGAGGSPRPGRSFEELKAAASLLKEQTGYEKLSVCLDPPALKKTIPELAIDLSAIAKGFAADSIAELLDEQKVTDYLIEVGGEVRSKGKKSKKQGSSGWFAPSIWFMKKADKDKDWIVGIEKPVWESSHEFSGLHQALPLKDQSLATSGNYLQTRQIGDHRISHIIDPRTGLPAQIDGGNGELASVAVIAPTCTHADAWATALFVLGDQKGRKLADQHGIAALFLLRNANEDVEVSSKHWGQ
jgi:thiamine biosynthesis lipoprotein